MHNETQRAATGNGEQGVSWSAGRLDLDNETQRSCVN